ncbi:Plasmodium exported protein (Pm-fam-a like), unknown function [Plasmodium malariae]|uniref:Fam-m protein n=1 Tax=Plasmodium malariae TaxID=5858 RepID=A0A1A8WQL8_PLAMA|nr:Plasmodium exported protein (Pm-fam-a like), unknown function [Plasmodium malariae]
MNRILKIFIMEQKIKLFLIIKIAALIVLIWTYHLNDNKTLNKYLVDNCNITRKLDTIKYRLLAKYKQDNCSNTAVLKEDTQYNRECEKKNVSSYKIWTNEKKKIHNRNLLNKAKYYTEVVDYNNGMFDGKHFHFEKKWIKKKDYDNFVEKNRRIHDIALKKINFRSYGFGVTQFFIFLFLGIGLAILPTFDFWKDLESKIENIPLFGQLYKSIDSLGKNEQFYIYLALFSVILITLSLMLIIGIYKILRNNEKYNKIKIMTG